VTNTDVAAFIHADYRLTDHFGFTAGCRFTSVKTDSWRTERPQQLPVLRSRSRSRLRYFPAIPDSQTWHIFDPTVGVQYHINDDVMTYSQLGKGFKQAVDHAPVGGNHGPEDARFDPEYSSTTNWA